MAEIVVITGTNVGIRFEVARRLGRSGFTVLLGSREVSRGEAAAAKLRSGGSDVRAVVANLDGAAATSTALPALISGKLSAPSRSALPSRKVRRCFASSSNPFCVSQNLNTERQGGDEWQR